VETGLISGVNAAALVSAGVISVLVFPVVALGLLGGGGRVGGEPATVPVTRSDAQSPPPGT
jgi:hypothetical protein